jgi:hypothetical protein
VNLHSSVEFLSGEIGPSFLARLGNVF